MKHFDSLSSRVLPNDVSGKSIPRKNPTFSHFSIELATQIIHFHEKEIRSRKWDLNLRITLQALVNFLRRMSHGEGKGITIISQLTLSVSQPLLHPHVATAVAGGSLRTLLPCSETSRNLRAGWELEPSGKNRTGGNVAGGAAAEGGGRETEEWGGPQV
ncbi:hypothetical protein SLA2020_332190 [Shorea laevis]